MCTAVEYRPYTGLSMEPCCHTRRCATITSQHGTSGLLERAAITHCAGCAANDRPIVVSAEMHAISQRGLEGGDARFGPVPGPRCTDFSLHRLPFCNTVRFCVVVVGGGGSDFGQVQLSPREGRIPDRFRQVWTGFRKNLPEPVQVPYLTKLELPNVGS